jgi:hypothetical protein
MTKHLLPSTALIAFAAAKRKAALAAEAQYTQRQLSLDVRDIRHCPGLYDPRLVRTAERDDED